MRVRIDKAYKEFPPATKMDEPVRALTDVSIDIDDSEFICLVGPSGCGKSTLLQTLAGLESLTAGQIVFEGLVEDRDPTVSVVFQEFALFPWMTVADNIGFAPRMKGSTRAKVGETVDGYIRLLGLQGFEDRYPGELSGGMQQRVAIGRALATTPDLLLMDEPFGALDAQTRRVLQDELLSLWQSTRNTVLFVTHSIEEAVILADRVYVMTARPGRIKKIVDIDIPRPRDARIRKDPVFVELTDAIWSLLHEEVQVNVAS